MILAFRGGVKPLSRTLCGKKEIEYVNTCSASCIRAFDDASAAIPAGKSVLRGALLGESEGTPVYAPIAGVFRGILELENKRYFTVVNNGEEGEALLFNPEERSLTEMDSEYIIEAARRLAIRDSRSGLPLWKLLSAAVGCKRVVVDCTESDSESAIAYRLCIEKAKSAVGGAKVMLHCIGALKCVFAAEHYRNAAFDALQNAAGDEKLFAFGRLDEKYPYTDRTLMDALYVKDLAKGETAIEKEILIVGIEAAVALYDAMVSGIPQLTRYISVCGGGFKGGSNLCVPKGITKHDILELCGSIKPGYELIENSLLCGKKAGGSIGNRTRALISVKPAIRQSVVCIGCGSCASVCPMLLMPAEALSGSRKKLLKYCVACGACQFICPSNIPLLELIGTEFSGERSIPQKGNEFPDSDEDAPEVML